MYFLILFRYWEVGPFQCKLIQGLKVIEVSRAYISYVAIFLWMSVVLKAITLMVAKDSDTIKSLIQIFKKISKERKFIFR